jgi:hypothetical protein
VKKVLRGALVAGVAFAACAGFSAQASAVEAPASDLDVDIANNACILPWYWQGPLNLLIGEQDGSYAACNSAADDGGVDVLNNACILPWYWQGPINLLLGEQDGEYAACNSAGSEMPEELPETLIVPEGVELPADVQEQLLEVLPEGTEIVPAG